jgi:hypothetical protein
VSGELRGLVDGALRDVRLARVVADDDVRAGVVGRVQPEIVRARDLEGQLIVVARGAADEDFVAVR